MKIKLLSLVVVCSTLAGCGSGESYQGRAENSSANRVEHRSKIEGFDRQTLRKEDAMPNSLPGNRQIIDLNELQVTADPDRDEAR